MLQVEPDMTREGGSIPVTLTLQQATGKNVILLPMGACDDGAHSQNEKIDIRNYIEGVSIFESGFFFSNAQNEILRIKIFFNFRQNYWVLIYMKWLNCKL